MTNFADLVVDYPNAKEYAFQVCDKLQGMGLLSEDLLSKYK